MSKCFCCETLNMKNGNLCLAKLFSGETCINNGVRTYLPRQANPFCCHNSFKRGEKRKWCTSCQKWEICTSCSFCKECVYKRREELSRVIDEVITPKLHNTQGRLEANILNFCIQRTSKKHRRQCCLENNNVYKRTCVDLS